MRVLSSRKEIDALARRAKNPVHTAVFAVSFVLMVGGLPLVVGGLLGLLLAPVMGAALWGLYRVTLPRFTVPNVATTAGTTPCPACGSMQTDHAQFRSEDDPMWRCFACEHRW